MRSRRLVLPFVSLCLISACSEDGIGRVGAEIEVQPARLDLGNTPVGVIAQHTITVRNRGQVTLDVQSMSLLEDAALSQDLAIEGAVARSLRPGEIIELVLTHVPRDVQLDSGVFRVASDDADTPNYDLLISQDAIGAPDVRVVRDFATADLEAGTAGGISASVEAIVFPDVAIGVRQTETVFVVNSGNGNIPLEVTSMALIDAPAGLSMVVEPDFGEDSLLLPRLGADSRSAQVRNAKVTLSWAPTSAEFLASTLRITTSLPNRSTIDIPITGGTLAGDPPRIRIEPRGGLNFTSLGVHVPVDAAFTVFNDGETPLILEPLAIDLDTHGVFALVDASRRVTIAAGASEHFQVRFTPHTEDMFTASIPVLSNDPATPRVNYPLSSGGSGTCTPTTIDPGEPLNEVCATAIDRGALNLGINSTESLVWSDSHLDGEADLDWARVNLSVAAGCFLSGYDIGARATTAPGETAEICVRIGDCAAPDREECGHGSARAFIFPGDDICEAHGNNVPVYVQVRFVGGELSCRPYTVSFDAR